MSLVRYWVVPAIPFMEPNDCDHRQFSDCGGCRHCGSEIHVVEDYAPNGRCHCGRTPFEVER